MWFSLCQVIVLLTAYRVKLYGGADNLQFLWSWCLASFITSEPRKSFYIVFARAGKCVHARMWLNAFCPTWLSFFIYCEFYFLWKVPSGQRGEWLQQWSSIAWPEAAQNRNFLKPVCRRKHVWQCVAKTVNCTVCRFIITLDAFHCI